jgi:hypothetical protein
VLSYIVFARAKPRIISPDRHSSKFQPQFDPSNASPRFKNSAFLIQPDSFHSFPHSFGQWTTTNSFPFNPFHTLSIVMGGVGALPDRTAENLNRCFKYSQNHQIFCRPFFSTTYELPIFYPLCFDIHACNGGGTPLAPFRMLQPHGSPTTGHGSPGTDHNLSVSCQSHCGPTPLVPQWPPAQDFFTLRGNNSALPGV